MRPRGFMLADIIFMSLQRPQLQLQPGVCSEHQCPCNNPAVSESNSWWRRSDSCLFSISSWWRWQWCGTGRWQEWIGRCTLLQLFGGLSWSCGWRDDPLPGQREMAIHTFLMVCLRVLTQLLVTAHPTCHGTGPTSPGNRPSFRHLNNLVHVFTERWQSQVHWPLYTSLYE